MIKRFLDFIPRSAVNLNNFAEKISASLEIQQPSVRPRFISVTPLLVFLGLYVAISLIIGDFYKIPLSVALIAASLWAMVIITGRPLTERIEAFAREAGSSNVIYMIWIFILAGAFATLADKSGAVKATVVFTMNQLPPQFVIPGLFLAACFISMAIGTSVGTVVALTPLAVNFAAQTGADLPFLVAVILGGAFFGDNLSFISDTTIAATRTQQCKMSDKFRANIVIVCPAALITFIIYLFGDMPSFTAIVTDDINPWLMTPYLIVIILAVLGVNVTVTLVCGLLAAFAFALGEGIGIFDILGYIGEGVDNMGNLIIVTLLAAGMLGLIKIGGGIEFILVKLRGKIGGKRGAQGAMAMLVGIVNLCTANNTVAILTVGSISRDISQKYHIQPRRSASILDTASCIVQCLIPYGAQTLLAVSLASISPVSPWPYLYYPWAVALMLFLTILWGKNR